MDPCTSYLPRYRLAKRIWSIPSACRDMGYDQSALRRNDILRMEYFPTHHSSTIIMETPKPRAWGTGPSSFPSLVGIQSALRRNHAYVLPHSMNEHHGDTPSPGERALPLSHRQKRRGDGCSVGRLTVWKWSSGDPQVEKADWTGVSSSRVGGIGWRREPCVL